MRLSRPIITCVTASIHNLGVSPWLMPRSNRSICSGTCANKGSSASFSISSRATSASRRSTTTPVRSADSIRACRSASRSRIGRLSAAALPPLFGASDMDDLSFSGSKVPLIYQLPHLPQRPHHSNDLYRAQRKKTGGPARKTGWGRPLLGRILDEARSPSSGCAVRLFHDREAHRAAVAIFLRDFAPAVFRFLAGLERAFDLG